MKKKEIGPVNCIPIKDLREWYKEKKDQENEIVKKWEKELKEAKRIKAIRNPQDILEQITDTLSKTHQDKMDFHNKQLDEIAR